MRLLPWFLVALVACSSAPAKRERPDVGGLWPELEDSAAAARHRDARVFPARQLTKEQYARLRAAEQVYRGGDDLAFGAERDRLAEDPITAFWLARLLVAHAVYARDHAAPSEQAMVQELPWARPNRHLVGMGPAAAPCVVLDLLAHTQSDRRAFAAEILTEMGPQVLPAWQRVFAVEDPRVRRAAVGVVAAWEQSPETLVILEDAAKDRDFGVRAAAYGGLAKGGSGYAAQLREALANDPDPFVRRAIVEAIGEYQDRDSAEAVVRYLERSIAEGDATAVLSADRTLRRMSGRGSSADLATWQAWVSTLPQED